MIDSMRDGIRFGPLEWRVLEALWTREAAASVRDLEGEFPELAYTTLMTTLDRLYRKGVLERQRSGRAFHYSPRLTRTELDQRRAVSALDSLLAPGTDPADVRPVLSHLVESVGARDRELLGELERLVRARRRAARGRRK
jgi:predicted transcriptional regulator